MSWYVTGYVQCKVLRGTQIHNISSIALVYESWRKPWLLLYIHAGCI